MRDEGRAEEGGGGGRILMNLVFILHGPHRPKPDYSKAGKRTPKTKSTGNIME
jgi:hypothetical protein